MATPHFEVRLDLIEQRALVLRTLANRFNISLLFAVKSFPDKTLLSVLDPYLDGYDISNLAEHSLLENKDKTLFVSNPGRPTLIPSPNVYHSVLSETQLEQVLNFKQTQKLYLRAYAFDLLGLSLPKKSRFGFDIMSLQRILVDNENSFEGISLHTGRLENKSLAQLKILKRLTETFPQIKSGKLSLNLGGGFQNISFDELADLFCDIREIVGDKARVFIEPGHYYTENAIVLRGEILDVHISDEKLIVVTSVSNLCHLNWSSPKVLSSPFFLSTEADTEISFLGLSCSERELICSGRVSLPTTKFSSFVGSEIVFAGISSYSIAWNTSFNGIPKADVSFINALEKPLQNSRFSIDPIL